MGKTLGNGDDTSIRKRGTAQWLTKPCPRRKPQRTRQAWSVLIVSTFAFTVCFMVWMMFGVIGIPIKKMLNLNSTQFGLLMSMPVLTGSLVRVPLGIWTDRYGGRIVMAAVMATTVPAIWMMGYATEYWHFLTIGLFVGLAGGSFSVGTPYVARWFPKNRQGTAMGVYGAGNSGAAVDKFVAPVILVAFGWTMVPGVRRHHAGHRWCCSGCSATATPPIWCPANVKFTDQLKALKDPRCSSTASTTASCSVAMWPCRCGWCSTTWESMVWTSAWPPCWLPASRCPVACCAPLAACCLTSTAPTSVTWWVMWVSWICLFLLSYPQTDFTITTVNGPQDLPHWPERLRCSPALMFTLGIARAFGKASVFKYISNDYPTNIGAISGIVGLAGGLGGFVLPIMFGALLDLTGIRSSAFMLLYGVVWVSLIWMYFTEVRQRPA